MRTEFKNLKELLEFLTDDCNYYHPFDEDKIEVNYRSVKLSGQNWVGNREFMLGVVFVTSISYPQTIFLIDYNPDDYLTVGILKSAGTLDELPTLYLPSDMIEDFVRCLQKEGLINYLNN